MAYIREATVDDAARIAEIYKHFVLHTTISFETEPLSTEAMAARIADIQREYPYFVQIADDDRIAGFCYVHRWKERAAYARTVENSIYIDPEYQGRGYGRGMMEHLIEACRQRGIKVIIACITGGNERSCELHRRLGFTQVSLFKNVGQKFGQILDVVDYEMEI